MEREIYCWADGTWCDRDELWQYGHMSDDHMLIKVHWEASDEDIDRIVHHAHGGNK